MIKHSTKYIYSLMTITFVIGLNKMYAQETSNKVQIQSTNENNVLKYVLTINDVDKHKLNLIIKEAERRLSNANVGTTDGSYPQVAIDNFKLVINESKEVYQSNNSTQAEINSQVLKLEKAIEAFKSEEVSEYLEHKEKLKGEIQECKNILANSKEGSAMGEYSKQTIEKFKMAISEAEKIVAKSDKKSDIYIQALEILKKAKSDFQASVISNVDLEKYYKELTFKLNEISKTIKEAEVGLINGGVSENQKIALSVIYSEIKTMVKDKNDVDVYKKAITLAKYALSDFNDRTISIDKNNKVNGRKLTGVIYKPTSKPTNITMTNKEEFIPQAGIPFDIKLLLNVTGTCFLGLGTIMFRKEPK